MRIAHFIDTEGVGGAEVLVLEMLSDAEDAYVYHFGRGPLANEIARRGVSNKVLGAYRLYKSAFTLPLFVLYFAFVLLRDRVTVLHSHLVGAITAGALSSRISATRHVGTLHDVYSLEERPSRARILRFTEMLGTKLVCVSRNMQDRFAELSGANTLHTALIYNGVKEPKKHHESARPPLCKQLNLNPALPIFVCVARLDPIKDHRSLLAAFQQLPDCHLLIVGDGPLREVLTADVPNNVRFLGFRTDVTDILTSSDCFVLSSLSEGLSCSIAEAMACGLPIIATDVGGNNELVVDGENGFLVPCHQPQALVEAVTNMLQNPQTRTEFGAHSRERIRSTFSFVRMMQQYKALYRNEDQGRDSEEAVPTTQRHHLGD